MARLVYRDGALVSSASISINQPVVAESWIFGGLAEENDQMGRIVNSSGAVYLTNENLLYRVIGPESAIGSDRVTIARYLATS